MRIKVIDRIIKEMQFHQITLYISCFCVNAVFMFIRLRLLANREMV